ncbi:class I SAM-dependent methyltransferase [Umezawaea sp. NPDC059074]|uniref:class I SAM-dependent methyltransferase n=1 Tax=Umezawaea sp. NPDC059074 TaxID=3346716 RepID=UPI0036985977
MELVDNSRYDERMSEVYDLVYRGRGKEYAEEAAAVAEVVRARRPSASSILDVACGTGEHLASLRSSFGHVEGLELSPHMRAVATAKLPGVTVTEGDMRGFELGWTFDAVCCLYSAVGYTSSPAELTEAIRRMALHLAPGGVLVVEPWWLPERFLDGHVGDDVVRGDGKTVARVSQSRRTGDVVRQETHYVVADEAGIRHFTHVQHLRLFTAEEYTTAFDRAGCAVEHLDDDRLLSGRGLFVGVKA